MAATIGVLPKEYQARRTFKGLLPEYYQKIIRTRGTTTDKYDFYFDSFSTGLSTLCCSLLITYEDTTKNELVSVEQTFLLIINPSLR